MSVEESKRTPLFLSNYPNAKRGLLTTPQRVNADPTYTGRGVVIAFVDSGFYMHPDIAERVVVHVDATTANIKVQPRVMQSDVTSWHGLMTATVACGDGAASRGRYRGIASDSQLVLIKVSNLDRNVHEPDIERGLMWLIQNHARYGVRIVNCSVGGDFVSTAPDHPLHRCVAQLTNAGVTVVVAAGNRAEAVLVPPASAPQAIVVGGYDDHNSLDRTQWQAYPSNYGTAYNGTPKPDLIAPAKWIASPILPETSVERQARWLGMLLQTDGNSALRSLLALGLGELDLPTTKTGLLGLSVRDRLQNQIHAHKLINTHYQHVDGTSVAAPIVTAVIAQMIEANPALQPPDIAQILRDTAQPLLTMPFERQGAGIINARKAVQVARNLGSLRDNVFLQHP